MLWPFHDRSQRLYWLKVFGWYAVTEASIQLVFLFVLNTFSADRISVLEFHLVMLLFQCLLIWPIWWVAYYLRKQHLLIQILANTVFYVLYSYGWFGPVQDAIGFLYNFLQQITRSPSDRQEAYLDRGYEYSYLNYQMLKHAFRLSWFYLAAYFYNYRQEEKQRLQLAVANKELQLTLLKWHLNPSFYFNTIRHLQKMAQRNPVLTANSILQLAKVMEYVIYEAKEKQISVRKEIQFLTSYIQLLNKQQSIASFQMETSGDHERLKISPLLLAGMIEKLANDEAAPERKIKICLWFQHGVMTVRVEAVSAKLHWFWGEEEALYQRLMELYPKRFSTAGTENTMTLSIQLNEE